MTPAPRPARPVPRLPASIPPGGWQAQARSRPRNAVRPATVSTAAIATSHTSGVAVNVPPGSFGTWVKGEMSGSHRLSAPERAEFGQAHEQHQRAPGGRGEPRYQAEEQRRDPGEHPHGRELDQRAGEHPPGLPGHVTDSRTVDEP